MKKRQTIMAVCACAAAGIMGITGMLAYMTDNETHTNTFSVDGKSKIDLVEDNWDTTDANGDGVPDAAERIVPNQEVKKDPRVINSGDAAADGGNDVIAFLRVTVPVKDVTRVADDGQIQTLVYNQDASETETDIAIWNEQRDVEMAYPAHMSQEIFYLKSNAVGDSITYGPKSSNFDEHENSFNPNWINLPTEESLTLQDVVVSSTYSQDGYESTATSTPDENNIMGNTDADVSGGTAWSGTGWTIGHPEVNAGTDYYSGAGQRVYVFGWHERLAPGESTETLFDKVQMKNIIENEVGDADAQNIKVEAFSIQADNVFGSYYTGNSYNREAPAYDEAEWIDTSSLDVRKLTAIYDTYIRQNGHVVTAADHAAGKYTDKAVGDMVYDFYQDPEHGSTEKEADINNLKDLHSNGIGQSITAWAETAEGTKTGILYIQPKEGAGSDARRYLFIKYKANAIGEQPASVTYKSTDTDVVTVDGSGKVKAVGIGDATIVVTTDSGAQAAVHVSVQSDSKVVLQKDYSNDNSTRPQGTSENP